MGWIILISLVLLDFVLTAVSSKKEVLSVRKEDIPAALLDKEISTLATLTTFSSLLDSTYSKEVLEKKLRNSFIVFTVYVLIALAGCILISPTYAVLTWFVFLTCWLPFAMYHTAECIKYEIHQVWNKKASL